MLGCAGPAGSAASPPSGAPAPSGTSARSGAPAASDRCSPGARQEVTGVVLSVVGTTPTQVSSFTVRTNAGETITFTVGPAELTDGAFPAGHLREHQATAAPVVVAYRQECDTRVALRLTDG